MASKNTYYQKDSLSPYEVFQWIQNEVFRHIKKQNWLEKSVFEQFENIFKIRFSENFQKVKSFVNNDLDKGNVSFAVLVVSLYEAFLGSWDLPKNCPAMGGRKNQRSHLRFRG